MESFLKCSICKENYNLHSKEPMVLFCCTKTACKECINDKMNAEPQQFKCSICKSAEFKGFGVNIHAKELVEAHQQKNLFVTCDKHH